MTRGDQRPVAQDLLKVVQQCRRAGDPGPQVQPDEHQGNDTEHDGGARFGRGGGQCGGAGGAAIP